MDALINILKPFIGGMLSLGAGVVLPIIMIFVGLFFRMKLKDAFSAALTLGVAFIGMGVVIGFMIGNIAPAGEELVKSTGIQLTAIDLGWSPVASIAWTWPFALLLFPLQITINIIMLAMNKTNTLNLDMWNVWNKVLTAIVVAAITGSTLIAFVVAAVQVVFELKNGDILQKVIEEKTHIPGVTCPHAMLLDNPVLYPIDTLLRKIPGLNKNIDAEALKDKIGIFAENHIMGFIIGCLIGVMAKFNIDALSFGEKIKYAVILGVQTGTALTLFPMVAKLFMQALSPISDAASEFMKKRFPGREFYIGLDWPILAGMSEIWVVAIILVPITLICALLPGNTVLPIAGIVNICLGASLFVVTGGHIIRMLIIGIIATPVYLYVATGFAPTITALARANTPEVVANLSANQFVSWSTLECPAFRWIFSHITSLPGIVFAVGYLALFIFYYKGMRKRVLTNDL